MEKKVLLTGFDPFGGETVNPSWEAVKRLNGAAEAPPLSYPNKCRPFFISLLPYCARRSKSISLTLSSVSDRQAAECRSRRNGSRSISMRRAYRITKETSLSGKTFLKTVPRPIATGLPIKRIVEEIKKEGIPAAVSYTAGTFVCNHLFYGLMDEIACHHPHIRGGFIHIPYIPEQTLQKSAPSLSLDLVTKALKIAAVTAAAHEDDIETGGGELH